MHRLIIRFFCHFKLPPKFTSQQILMNSKQRKDPVFQQFQTKNKKILKQYAKGASADSQQQHKVDQSQPICQDTMTKPIPVSKIKIQIDDEETRKFGWEQKYSTQPGSDKKKQSSDESSSVTESVHQTSEQCEMVEIPYNKQVEDILAKKPLRQRLGGLLPVDQQLPIAFNHQQLLKRMELIDRTIDFLQNHRNLKTYFFQTVKKSIFETGNTFIEYKNFQQLTFLDENCYNLEWKMNEKIRRYDIRIQLPAIGSMDNRKAEMRNKIVQFLKLKEEDFLKDKGLQKTDERKWHPDFKYQQIQIPSRQLPVHPNAEKSDLRKIQNKEISKIANPHLKKLFESKKKNPDSRSISGASVADMIFSRMPSQDISSRIMDSIRQKEKINKQQQQRMKKAEKEIDRPTIIKICQQILLIYMGKNVTNIFKTTLIELLQGRLKFKDDLIVNYVNRIITAPELNFLTEIESSKKLKVLTINRQKYKSAREYFEKGEQN